MNREEIVDFLSKLVAFDTSINPGKDIFPDNQCQEFLHQHAKSHGYEILTPKCSYNGDASQPLFPVLVVKRGSEEGPNVLFLGHIDVVPVSEAEKQEWDFEAFNPEERDGLLLGRGSGDMKGGVTAFFSAFDNFDISRGNVIIALSGDEEIGGMDTVPEMIKVLKQQDLTPDYVINAEGASSPIIVTKRRGGTQVKFEFDLDYDHINGTSKTIKFRSSLGDGSEGLHSMSYLQGASIHAMLTAAVHTQDKYISLIHSSSSKTNSVPREVIVGYVEHDPSLSEEVKYSKGLTKLMHALATAPSLHFPIEKSKYGPSICPNLIEIDEDNGKGSLTFDIRAMLTSSNAHEEIAELIKEHFQHFGLKTTYEMQLTIDPVNVDPDIPLANIAEKHANHHGYKIISKGEKLGGASDTRFFTSLGIPGIELGPLATNAHGINETVSIDSIMKLKEIYQDIYLELLTLK